MKTATIVIFQLPRTKKKIGMGQACKLYRKLYGYNNSSCYGRYHTRVSGLLDQSPYIRLSRSVIIVLNSDAQRVIDLLKEFEAEVIFKQVILEIEDMEKLGLL